MKTLVLVRHGQSTWNVEHRIQGQADPSLSPLGQAQADRTAAWLADAYPQARVVTSDLARCHETAAPLATALGLASETHRGLRERDFGAWTGHLHVEVAERWPELHRTWRAGGDVVDKVGGETTPTLVDRVLGALEDVLAATAQGDAAVVVTHGGPIWHGLHRLLRLAEPSLGAVANTSISELLVGDEPGLRLLGLWNQVGHLPVELRTWFQLRSLRAARPGVEAAGDGRT